MSKPVPLQEVIRLPAPGLSVPIAPGFAPDGRITYLHSAPGAGAGLQRVLWAWDPGRGEQTVAVAAPGGGVQEGALSLEEQLRRERLRERGLGISRYRWSRTGDTLMIPLSGGIWVQRGLQGTLTRIVEAAIDPQLSPDGSQVAYVDDAEIFVIDVDGGEARQLTHGARGTGRTHGLAEYVAQEEMGRHHGLWWSRDGRWIAYAEVDETHIPTWRIPHQGRAGPSWEDHRYPFAGADNAIVSLWVVPVDGSAPPRRLALQTEQPWEYLARVAWLADGQLLAVVQDRRQQRIDLVRVDPQTGAEQHVLTETSAVWINLHDVLWPLQDEPGAFLWASEASGFLHLQRVGADGGVTTLTHGDWCLDALVGVDEASSTAWILASVEDPLQRHLYAVPLGGGPLRRITTEPGWHTVTMDRSCTRLLDRFSDLDAPPRLILRDIDGNTIAELQVAADPRIEQLALIPPELIEVRQRDGVLLHGALYRPAGDGPHPLVVMVYGGPHVQRVVRSWSLTAELRAQHLCREGFAVLKLDNRGSARRGLAFEGAIRGDMGHLELLDQIDGVQHLIDAGIADPDRIAITGWSYGGYLSAMAVARYPEVFHAAIAGAPVTHWDGYDTHYTERYMGLPSENPDGYTISSVMHHVGGLRGRLMLVHGMLDENVHFRHTARLIDALVREDKDVTLQIYPDERHAPRDEAGRLYMLRRELAFLEEALRPTPG